MTDGTDQTTARSTDSEVDARAADPEPDAVAAVGAYEDNDDTVFYDSENPLAWVQTDRTVELAEMV